MCCVTAVYLCKPWTMILTCWQGHWQFKCCVGGSDSSVSLQTLDHNTHLLTRTLTIQVLCRGQRQQCMQPQHQSSMASLAPTCKTAKLPSQLQKHRMLNWQPSCGPSLRHSWLRPEPNCDSSKIGWGQNNIVIAAHWAYACHIRLMNRAERLPDLAELPYGSMYNQTILYFHITGTSCQSKTVFDDSFFVFGYTYLRWMHCLNCQGCEPALFYKFVWELILLPILECCLVDVLQYSCTATKVPQGFNVPQPWSK